MKIAVIGAGISGLVSAYLLNEAIEDAKIDIYEKRNGEIGGNCYDIIDDSYIQKYGPHIFHTNNKDTWDFVNRFASFEHYQHKVVSYIKGNLEKIPLHTDEVHVNFVDSSKYDNAQSYLYANIGSKTADLYFKNYSEKQWGIPFNELPTSIVNRIPINEVGEDRYFPKDKYQGIPLEGFSQLCRNLFRKSSAELIYKNVTYEDVKHYDLIILTGRPDIFFNSKFGELKYRYTDFEFREHDCDSYQEYSVINYPNDYDFTRITEFNKFLPHTNFKKSTVCFEYPTNNDSYEPCYPIFWNEESKETLKKYQDTYNNKILYVGRLARYQYLNIDKAIEKAHKIINSYLEK